MLYLMYIYYDNCSVVVLWKIWLVRRLVSRVTENPISRPRLHLAFTAHATAYTILTPFQLGVGVGCSCKAIVRATSQLMSSSHDDWCWTLLLDFSNTFNNICQEAMFAQFHQHLSPPISLDGVLLLVSGSFGSSGVCSDSLPVGRAH